MGSTKVTAPSLKDLTIDNITPNVHLVNSPCQNRRLKYLLERLVTHLHDFVRETRLSTDEWMTGIEFLTAVGQICTDVRQEFILLSDILGVSLLVDSVDHPKPEGATEGTVLGPFHTHEAHSVANGESIAGDPDGQPCLVLCSVRDTSGKPISGVRIDVWETDSKGFYDVQYADRTGPDGRGIVTSDDDGLFWFKAIVPVPYPIPHDGPVGKLLGRLGRHPYRPSHMHFKFDKEGYDPLITALYVRNDPYENSDAVFGVKNSLVVDVKEVKDREVAENYGAYVGCALIEYDFVLVLESEALALREQRAAEAMKAQGRKVTFLDGLPVPELD
ncbi:Uncharacterized protein SAPIO_CDS9498 [Scedosporium apiospermum]|uniref:Hydroxyquinol 1,2-dioxygenase n=1 Tax=Pseudallescheria apiosperma TaxID=563466 RepID=A0A084FWX5_PSEDA|nr:Uncharacterized protein SAPIO_CDS9498 [Scedosporium apiospermum]KEZ39587.1 Uncharacterized protein SAPIO_CDS9498 [Scedosporium apiospermum]